jgi:hypothetical protein
VRWDAVRPTSIEPKTAELASVEALVLNARKAIAVSAAAPDVVARLDRRGHVLGGGVLRADVNDHVVAPPDASHVAPPHVPGEFIALSEDANREYASNRSSRRLRKPVNGHDES